MNLSHLLVLAAVLARAADVAAAAAPAPLPFWLKVAAMFGAAACIWKMVQGAVPQLVAFLMGAALRAVDLFVLAVVAQPVLRWLIVGDKDNFLATANALLDGLKAIGDAVEARLKADLDAASAGQPLPPVPGAPPAQPPAAPPPPQP